MTSRAQRWGYIAANIIELWLGAAALVSAISFFVDTETLRQSAIGQTLHPVDYVWNAGYGLGGLLIVLGIVFARPRYEAVGLCLFSAGTFISATALVYVTRLAAPSALFLVAGIGIACLLRVRLLLVLAKRGAP